jgi:hypothetical protein
MASFKDLSSATMVHITAAWLDAGRTRPLLEKLKRVAPLLEDVESAHEGLLKAHNREEVSDGAAAALQAEQLGLDQTHDRKARGTFGTLTAFVEIADTPEQAASYQRALDALFPDGMRIVNAPYAEEAGRTKLVRERLSPEVKATLKAISSPDGTLLKTVAAWLDAGDALGALEEKRAKMEAAAARNRQSSGGGHLLRARNRWINVVRAVVDMIELEEPIGVVRDEVLGPLDRALAQASRRAPAPKVSPKVDAGSAAPKAAPDQPPAPSSASSSPPPA